MLTVGLRFRAKDARRLQELADRWASEGTNPEGIGLFTRAAADARLGEPLRILCESAEEAKIMADGFVLYGVTRPAIEALES